MSTVSTHVLDTVAGGPAAGVPVRLERAGDSRGAGRLIAAAVTDRDGRVGELGPTNLPSGVYRLLFDTAGYFARAGRRAFFPEVAVSFVVDSADGHYHVPVLLSPFGYTTYRGS